MDDLIEVGSAELGYCLLCHRPETVVAVSFKGWAHRAYVCDPCVQELAATVRRRVVAQAISINPPTS